MIAFQGFCYRGRVRLGLSDVTGTGNRESACCRNLASGGFQRFPASGHEDKPRTFCGEYSRRRKSDPGTRACDDYRFSLEQWHIGLLVVEEAPLGGGTEAAFPRLAAELVEQKKGRSEGVDRPYFPVT
jgi:hypothetical protein